MMDIHATQALQRFLTTFHRNRKIVVARAASPSHPKSQRVPSAGHTGDDLLVMATRLSRNPEPLGKVWQRHR